MLGTIFDLEPSGKKCPIVILEAYWHDVRESGGIVFLKVVFMIMAANVLLSV